MINKIHIVGMVLVTLFALSAATLTSVATAETTLLAEWLIGGKEVTSLTSSEIKGSIIFKDAKIGLEIVCDGVLDGSVGSNGEGEITELLTTGGTTVTLAVPLKCTSDTGCTEPAEATAESLPWHTLLYLTEGGLLREHLFSASYWTMCNIMGILTEETCTDTNASYEVLNVTGGVEATGTVTPFGECTEGGKESGQQTFVAGNLLTSTSGEVTASSEAGGETTLLAEWLIGGKEVATLTLTEAKASIIIKDGKIGLEMTCGVVFDGSVGPNGEDEVTGTINRRRGDNLVNFAAAMFFGHGLFQSVRSDG